MPAGASFDTPLKLPLIYAIADDYPHFLVLATKLAAVLRDTILVDKVRFLDSLNHNCIERDVPRLFIPMRNGKK